MRSITSISRIIIIGLLYIFIPLTRASKCPPQEPISRHVICYYEGRTSLNNLNLCNCTHIIFTDITRIADNYTLDVFEDARTDLALIKEKKSDLPAIFTLKTKPEQTSSILKSDNKRERLTNGIAGFLRDSGFDGIEINFGFNSQDGATKESLTTFLKGLRNKLDSTPGKRVKRDGYEIFEKVQDDVTTASYSTQRSKNSKTSTTKKTTTRRGKNSRTIREERKDVDFYDDDEELPPVDEDFQESPIRKVSRRRKELDNSEQEQHDEAEQKSTDFLIFFRMSTQPEIIGKKYDLKTLSKYADLLMVPTHNIVDETERRVTYHPSRLMGLSDMLNTDSILDLLTGLGAPKSKLVITMPATLLKFQLSDPTKNIPRSPTLDEPKLIDQSQLCSLVSEGNWTVERDDDLTAPYAFSDKTWLAFEDKASINIKGKYILLRELAGGAIYPIDADVGGDSCNNETGSIIPGSVTNTLFNNFRSLERKPRALVLESLQEEIHDTSFSSLEAGLHLSEYRIVRVVDHSGAVHVIRKNTKTQFECSRQGYFSHPLGCNKFYRCVKFNQYSDDFTVFEYDCPAGLAFDERWEVCVWPGSLPHGAPCTGSSEIAPVPRSHYQCPNVEGYYADPENCRWFFACLDHARNGITPLTAYEFRCPFGLVFDEGKLACDWPWLVGGCGNRGISGVLIAKTAGSTANVHTATFINGGNLAASYGQYGQDAYLTSYENSIHEASGFGIKSHAAGASYIASSYDDNQNKAAFATIPEYEISGGRILNHGGVVLNQHLNLVGVSGQTGSGYNDISQYSNIEFQKVKTAVPVQQSQVLLQPPLVETIAEKAVLTKLDPTLYQYPLSTPRPFAVDLPSVQVNEEKESSYSSQTIISSTPETYVSSTPETYVSSTPQTIVSSTLHAAKAVSEGYVYEKPSVQFQVPVVTTKPEVHQTTFQGYSYEKPKIAFELPKVQNELVHSISLKEHSVELPAPRPFEVEQPIVQYQPIAIKSRPIVHSTPAPVFYKQAVSVTPVVQEHKYVTPVQVSSPRPFSIIESVSISTPRPVVYEQKQEVVQPVISTPRPFTIQQEIVQPVSISTPRPVVYHQKQEIIQPVISTPRPFTIQQEVVQPVSISTPRPVVYEQRQYLPPPKPVVYEQQIQISTPKPVVYHQQYAPPPKPVVYEQQVQISTPKPVVYQQQYVPAPKPVVYEQQVQISTPKPVVYHQQYAPPPKPVVYEQQVQISTPKPVVYQQQYVPAPKPVVYEQQVQINTPKPIVYEQKQYLPPVQVSTPKIIYETPKVAISTVRPFVYEQKQVVPQYVTPAPPPKPVVYEQVQISTPRPVIYEQRQQYIPPPKPVQVQISTPKPIVYEQRQYLPPPKPVVYEQQIQISTPKPVVYEQRQQYVPPPKPVVYEQQVQISTPKVVYEQRQYLPPPKPVVYEQVQISTPKPIVVQPLQETPKPIVYEQPIQVSTPKPVLYTPKVVQPVQIQQEYVSIKQPIQISTPRPVVYTQSIRLETPKPVVYAPPKIVRPVQVQQEYVQISTPKPVVYTQSVKLETPKPVVYTQPPVKQYVQVSTSKPVVVQPVQVQQEYIQIKQKPIRLEYLPPETPKSVLFGLRQKPIRYEQKQFVTTEQTREYLPPVSTPQPVLQQVQISTPQPVVTQKEYLPPVTISTPKPVYQQEFVQVSTPKPIYRQQFVQPVSRPQEIFYKQQPQTLVVQQPVEVSTSKIIYEETITEKPAPIIVEQRYKQRPVVYQEEFQVQNLVSTEREYLPPSTTEQIVYTQGTKSRSRYRAEEFTKKTKESTAYFVENYEKSNPALSVLQQEIVPIVETREYLPPKSESAAVVDGYFEFQKLAKVKQDLVQENITAGYDYSSPKYTYNTKIEIAPPPQEYLLDVTSTTKLPEYSSRYSAKTRTRVRVRPTTSTTEANIEAYSGPDYLPPSSENYPESYIPPRSNRRRPSGKKSKTTVVSIGEVDKQEVDDENVEVLLDKYSGKFGDLLDEDKEKFVTKVIQGDGKGKIKVGKEPEVSTVGYEVTSSRSRQRGRGRKYGTSTTTTTTEEYEAEDITTENEETADVSLTSLDLKNLKLKKDKKTVIVVSQVSDANPLLIGKLASQCSCQSNNVELKKGRKNQPSNGYDEYSTTESQRRGRTRRPNVSDNIAIDAGSPNVDYRSNVDGTSDATILIGGPRTRRPGSRYRTSDEPSSRYQTTEGPRYRTSNEPSSRYRIDDNDSSSSLAPSSTTEALFLPEKPNGRRIPSRSRSRDNYDSSPNDISTVPLFSPIPADEIASTVDYVSVKGRRPENSIDDGIKTRKPVKGTNIAAGAAFDRYGPGGWRGADEMLQGSVDCKRPGLFRHPKYCNKFYSCNYDPWKKRYTLAVFNCPVHLAYDSNIGACNWPSKGPACADDNLLV